MINTYQILDWDSVFLGFKVAKILPAKMRTEEVIVALDDMKKEGVTLVYWASDPEHEQSQASARGLNAFLADRKVTYLMSAQEIESISTSSVKSVLLVEEYKNSNATHELLKLALQAGEFSRFKIDNRIPKERFIELYHIWIKRSVAKEIADAVFVVRDEDKVVGMVTVGEKDCRADIGLIAVSPSMRGKNAGKALVQAALNWGHRKGFQYAQVVTQLDNLPACSFYEKCGYRVEKVENIYHFWI